MFQRTLANHALNPMATGALFEEAASREERRHVCCAGHGCDRVEGRVDEEDGVGGCGVFLET